MSRCRDSIRSTLLRFPYSAAVAGVAAIAITLASPAYAQSEPLPTIGVSADATDPVGMEVLTQLRDAIKRSGFYPSTNAEQPLVGIHLLTVAPRVDPESPTTVYSAAWTSRDGHFLTHTVGTCSLKTAPDCANGLMVTTSQLARMQQTREANDARNTVRQ